MNKKSAFIVPARFLRRMAPEMGSSDSFALLVDVISLAAKS